MFLSPRFFLCLTLVCLTSVMGYWYMPLYGVARLMLAGLMVLLLADFIAVWTLGRVEAERLTQEKYCLNEDNDVQLRVESASPMPLSVTVRDELPGEFRFHRALFRLHLRARGALNVHYALRPVERGAYTFGHVLLFVSSPLGLVERKLRSGASQEVKVYPAFRRLDRLELAAVSENPAEGSKRIRRPGAQTEFEHIKDYAQGDEYRAINWKATARRRHLMVNTYQDEKAQPVVCVIDKGRAMQRTWGGMTLLDYAINASLALSYVAVRHDDMAGLLTFSAAVDTFLPASRRPTTLPLIMEELYAQHSAYAESDYSALRAYVGRHLRRRSLLVLYTDFANLDALERQLPYLRMIARDHPVLVCFSDDAEVDRVASSMPRTQEEYVMQTLATNFAQEKRAIASRLSACGIYALLTSPSRLPVDVIRRYLELKQRAVI
ncbi:MAG: DUF58 domain-containing protein [Alloprevotella sp.]|nr:DUF58 domain-containing protein [Alloprevotella sp.]